MVPKYAFLNDCFQQSVQLNKPMVQIPQGGLRQVLVICFLIFFRFKSSEAELGLSFEATFHCTCIETDCLCGVFSSSWSSKLAPTHSCSCQGLPKKRASEGFGNKCLNYTKQHN